MSFAQLAVDAAFTAYGVPASYLLAGVTPSDVRVIAKRPDAEVRFQGSSIIAATAVFEVRAIDVPVAQIGDSLLIGNDTYQVMVARCLDADRLVWTLECIIP